MQHIKEAEHLDWVCVSRAVLRGASKFGSILGGSVLAKNLKLMLLRSAWETRRATWSFWYKLGISCRTEEIPRKTWDRFRQSQDFLDAYWLLAGSGQLTWIVVVFSPYRAVNTLRFTYQSHSVHSAGLYGKIMAFCREIHKYNIKQCVGTIHTT